MASRPEQLEVLENEIKKEIIKAKNKEKENFKKEDDIVNLEGSLPAEQTDQMPVDLLLTE
jgi:hypothetical protein